MMEEDASKTANEHDTPAAQRKLVWTSLAGNRDVGGLSASYSKYLEARAALENSSWEQLVGEPTQEAATV